MTKYEQQLLEVKGYLSVGGHKSFLCENNKTNHKKILKKLETLAKLAKKKDPIFLAVGCRALTILASEIRKEDNPSSINKIFKRISKYNDFSIISDWSTDKAKDAYFNPKLLPMLELAHYLAIDKEKLRVPESMKILNFAGDKTNGLDKCYTLFKFAEVLYDLGDVSNNNFERAERYIDDCLTYGNDYFKSIKASSSGEEIRNPGFREWIELCEKINALQFDIDMALLAKECGPGYAKYVEMRSFYDKKDFVDAFHISIELKTEYPGTVYGEAGRLYWCRMLLMNDRGEEYGDKALPSGVNETKKFIFEKDSYYKIYRGAALMALGEFYLTYKWDSKQAFIYYKKALEWFREVRNRKDSIDLFAKSADSTKQQNKLVKLYSAPQGEISSIDEWKRTKERKQDPKEIINRENSPWYVDECEKNCLFIVGFLYFSEGEFKEARKCFLQVKAVSRPSTKSLLAYFFH